MKHAAAVANEFSSMEERGRIINFFTSVVGQMFPTYSGYADWLECWRLIVCCCRVYVSGGFVIPVWLQPAIVISDKGTSSGYGVFILKSTPRHWFLPLGANQC
ncbi:hypothetical protein CAY60_000340 [Shouchella clausii]|nr:MULTISPECIES: hypothetical protein [Shouchella]ALA53492.1 hypothetical protein DB29_02664 [Shouchella clausii]MDO7283783.1 hypothetical protein [Shouchella clausii]MDO7303879.1 hypothetical protein [Shouchella clausii]MDP0464493.1 hypothetical protein [Shouchella rhizosphaerae]MDP5255922.1 hypothetical protein [Shouchella clausii]